jgi:periplasmic protein TonB
MERTGRLSVNERDRGNGAAAMAAPIPVHRMLDWVRVNGSQPMLLCAALSVSVHAAVLAYRVTPSSPLLSKTVVHGGDQSSTGSATTRVRVIPMRPATAAASSLQSATPEHQGEQRQVIKPAALSRSVAEAVATAPSAHIDPPTPSPPSSLPIEPAILTLAPDAQSQAAETSSPDDFDGSNYIPRPLLTVPPSSLASIVLDVPEGTFAGERYAGVLSLFIDEEGQVKHVAADGTTLPPEFEQVAREAFMASPFLAGQLEGRSVKSRLRVEVVFDSRP